MKLNLITITGADNGIKPEKLVELAKLFPQVEWGILFSPSNQGKSRFPTLEWQQQLATLATQHQLQLSAHLCGKWVRDLVSGSLTWDSPLAKLVKRVQLNMIDEVFMKLDLPLIKKLFTQKFGETSPNVILQTKRPFHRAEDLIAINSQGGLQFQMLYDVSGGKGQLPRAWAKPPEKLFCGLAGGLNPANIKEQLQKMANVIGEKELWLDMESGARIDEKFSLDQVQKYLETVTTFTVEPSLF